MPCKMGVSIAFTLHREFREFPQTHLISHLRAMLRLRFERDGEPGGPSQRTIRRRRVRRKS